MLGRSRKTGPNQKTRDVVAEREIWCCARCGRHLGSRGGNHHHRRNRGQGGSSKASINAPSNLLYVCGSGTTGCHGWITNHPAKARELGFSLWLNSNEDPRDVAVQHAMYGRVFLDDDGGWSHVPDLGSAA